jgi:hypothetical protein
MSRRFKGRHARVEAAPDAKPEPPLVLDDSNSFVDPMEPDVRKPLVLNGRRYAVAESIEAAERARKAKKKAATAEA